MQADDELGPACARCGLHGAHVCLDGIEAYASQRHVEGWDVALSLTERNRRKYLKAYQKRTRKKKGA